ncbi:2Fe-2S iron-sulfur cluster-binding protein [Oryzibacter oryziterrae]|uniref:2Fe-2S iron-sulfur cluster-binding protein n=1 Tax=Oryzibacter oryziterrae TaxID=2766474 RepID=UPI001F23F59A|nr:2Fe-2S iron-sulfur cluster-binding protein [Oryzibacter oryziterrae]
MTGFRHPSKGLIDRDKPLSFTFDGKSYSGFAGDTLASALIASGVRLVGRSFKYHRPRGFLGAGHDEPNGLVELREGARREPNVKATVAELHDGLIARSQNRWPSLDFDLLAVNGLLKPVFAAGFYYKTFMWPASFWEKLYEPMIRRAAGMGAASGLPDPDAYEQASAHCDLLVVGAGPAGLTAALTAARSGARVILAEDDFRLGGRWLADGGEELQALVAGWANELTALPNVTVLSRTTVAAAFDHGTFLAIERVADHHAVPGPHQVRQRRWTLTARRVLLATGAGERSVLCPGNDRPGVMLASAVRSYVNRFGAVPGRKAVVHTATDDGWQTAESLLAAGVELVAVLDPRNEVPAGMEGVARRTRVISGGAVIGTRGGKSLSAVGIRHGRASEWLDADLLCLSGGFNPAIQLMGHLGRRPVWSEAIAGFVMPEPAGGIRPIGAAAGIYGLREGLEQAIAGTLVDLADLGFAAQAPALPGLPDTPSGLVPLFWKPTLEDSGAKVFIDPQNDVCASDVVLAHREGYRSVEHLKRFTTLGMATDQGRTANVDAIAIMAHLEGRPMAESGVTLARPPVVPIALGAVAGARAGGHFRPVRKVPLHPWAEGLGAVFTDVGQWKRPQYFPRAGESDWQVTVNREVTTVRKAVGLTDVSTLGKFVVEGPDAGAYLDRVFATRPSAIAVGSCGYGLMLREDGFLKDDGMIARLTEQSFLVFVSTVHVADVWRHMQFCRQVLWPELDLSLADQSERWAQMALAGPKAEAVLTALLDEFTVDAHSLPPQAVREATVGGVPVRLFGLSFSGERAFEIAVAARHGAALAARLMDVGAAHGITAYGTEAMAVMRIEMGYAVGSEINGQTTAHDLGMAGLMDLGKDHVGRVLSQRDELMRADRPRLVGLIPVDPANRLRGGAHVLGRDGPATVDADLGWITSAAWSPTLGTSIALAMVKGGPDRLGDTVRIWDGMRGTDFPARIVSLPFIGRAEGGKDA